MASEKVTVRALLGLWENEEVVLAGVSHGYEFMSESEWAGVLEEMKERAPAGTSNWREAWLTIEVDPDSLRLPDLSASLELSEDQGA